MSGSVNNGILNYVNMLLSQISYLQNKLQQEERSRLVAETKLEVYRQDFLPIFEKGMMRTNYHLEHVQTGHVGEISHSREFQAGRTTVHSGSDLDNVRRLMETVQERQNEVQANATAEDIEKLHSAVASIRAQLEVPRSDRSVPKKAVGAIQRIIEKTGTIGLAELAKQAARSLF